MLGAVRIVGECQMQNQGLKSCHFFQALFWESWPSPSFYVKQEQMCASGTQEEGPV